MPANRYGGQRLQMWAKVLGFMRWTVRKVAALAGAPVGGNSALRSWCGDAPRRPPPWRRAGRLRPSTTLGGGRKGRKRAAAEGCEHRTVPGQHQSRRLLTAGALVRVQALEP